MTATLHIASQTRGESVSTGPQRAENAFPCHGCTRHGPLSECSPDRQGAWESTAGECHARSGNLGFRVSLRIVHNCTLRIGFQSPGLVSGGGGLGWGHVSTSRRNSSGQVMGLSPSQSPLARSSGAYPVGMPVSLRTTHEAHGLRSPRYGPTDGDYIPNYKVFSFLLSERINSLDQFPPLIRIGLLSSQDTDSY